MKKSDILTKLKVFGAAITLAATIVPVSGCAKKGENYIPTSEIFYDDNNTGIDDTFENSVPNSDEEISNVTKLETYLDLGKQLYEIISNMNSQMFDSEDRASATSELSYGDIENIDITEIQNLINEYNEITTDENGKEIRISALSPAEREKLYLIIKELYQNYVLINTYIIDNGYSDLAIYGLDLSKAILIDTAKYEGNAEDVEVWIDVYKGSNEYQNYYSYQNEQGFNDIITFNQNEIYDLVKTAIECESKAEEQAENTELIFEYDEKTYEDLENILNQYKECIYASYEITTDGIVPFLPEGPHIEYTEGTVPTK